MPSKEQTNRGGWRYKRPSGPRDREDHRNRHHNHLKPKERIQPTPPRTDYNIVYCECSDFFCKLDKFIGSHLNECNKHKKGNIPGAMKNGFGKLLHTVGPLVDPLVNIAVKIVKPVIKVVSKIGKIIYKGFSKAAKAVTSAISSVANVGKKIIGWLF